MSDDRGFPYYIGAALAVFGVVALLLMILTAWVVTVQNWYRQMQRRRLTDPDVQEQLEADAESKVVE